MISKVMTAAFGALLLGAAPALASDVKIFPYSSSANYCPAGFQPISINGVICCGTPNQSTSYQSMNAHPVRKVVRARRSMAAAPATRIVCPVGEKGCYSR